MNRSVQRAALEAKAKRVQGALAAVAVGGVLYLFIFFGVMSRIRTPLPGWVVLFLLPIPMLVIAIPVLRSWHRSLVGQAALAQVDSALESVDELEAEQRKRRDEA